jgi:hypothetical protein
MGIELKIGTKVSVSGELVEPEFNFDGTFTGDRRQPQGCALLRLPWRQSDEIEGETLLARRSTWNRFGQR